MLKPWKDWDRLGLRLFLLMWAALVLSHLAAWSLVVQTMHVDMPGPAPMHADRGFGPGMPRDGFDPAGPPPPRHELGAGMQGRMPTFPSLPPNLPWRSSFVDYGVRLIVIALAAWWGSRWLAQPVRRLVSAAQQLTPALAQGRPAPALNEG